MKHITVGILAHVDAGKTTLTEAMLYETGVIRSLGRVDHQDSFLDNNELERQRGITIFSKQARLTYSSLRLTILDTPGHSDFSAEMERTLQVLDCAVLVISGTDGVQSQARTIWKLLDHYRIPAFLFVNKTDLPGYDRERIMESLTEELSDSCVDFGDELPITDSEIFESIAVNDENMMNEFLESGTICDQSVARAIRRRELFPVAFGSALGKGLDHNTDVARFLHLLELYAEPAPKKKDFSARIYKISRDDQGQRLTWLKITGGNLKVKDLIEYGDLAEKVNQIRLYSGEGFEAVKEVSAGEVCAVTGLTATIAGHGLGGEEGETTPVLEPVLRYTLVLPRDVNPQEFFRRLKELEEEDPALHIVWSEKTQSITVQLMGDVQTEILTSMIKERYGVKVAFGTGAIVYKETVARPSEGVGHFEPLRHYAEVHLLIEPGGRGSGVQISTECSEDVLALNWQRLILTHVLEREHPGVLTGSGLTDVRITLLTGRAHPKHTEGGDFRQATYRAIRQGLMMAESVLLEPYCTFVLEVPTENAGRALSDLQMRYAASDPPEFGGSLVKISGRAPFATMSNYMSEVNAYSKGEGRLSVKLDGYDTCHNAGEVVASIGYNPDSDTGNPTGSVFCAHGAGFIVPWDQVPDYMHLDYVFEPDGEETESDEISFSAANGWGQERFKKKEPKEISFEDDAELQAIYKREFGIGKDGGQSAARKKWSHGIRRTDPKVKEDKHGNPIYPKRDTRKPFLIIDGYNIIFAWNELKQLARLNLDSARGRLLDILSNYQGYTGTRTMVVFDAYRLKGNPGKERRYQNLEIIYTREEETADAFIERTVHDNIKEYQITVATSDGLEQLTVMRIGALRKSARELAVDIETASKAGEETLMQNRNKEHFHSPKLTLPE